MNTVFLIALLGIFITGVGAAVFALVSAKKHGKPSHATVLAGNLRDEKLKSDIIINAIEDAVILVDADHIIQLFNPAASTLTGWKVEEALGLDYRSVVRLANAKAEEYPDESHPFARVFRDKKHLSDDQAHLLTQTEKRTAVNVSVSPLFDQAENVTGIVAILRDVSQQRKEEQQRAEFISTASHEMRTPVAAIEGYLALALNDKVAKIDSKARGYLEKAHTSTQHLGQLFQDLLTSAKAEDGRLMSHPKVVELGEFLEKLTEDLRFTAEKKGLGIEYIVGAKQDVIDATDATAAGSKVVRPFYYCNVDPDRLREVITNLFDNAVKYSEQGKISIGITGDDSVVQMYVRDTGAGIPQEDIPHLFQKFYRVDNSVTRTIGGTGLGLFISRKIIELYEGRIWVDSAVGKGSTFYINLPRLTGQKAQALKQKEIAPSPLQSNIPNGGTS
jgi:PAS domain S-box-containing protein